MKVVSTIQRVSGMEEATFRREYLEQGRPVILTDQVARWAAATRWSDDYLSERFGDRPVKANVHPDGLYTGHGVVEEMTTVGAILRGAADDPRRRSLVLHVLRYAPFLIPDFGLPTVVGPKDIEASGFWIKPQGTTSGLHFDRQNGLLAIVRGQKRVLMFAPEEAAHLRPCPVFELTDTRRRNWSEVDIFAPDCVRFPELAEAVYDDVVLEAGEMLFIPEHWWHAVSNDAPVTVSVNFFFNLTPRRPRPVFFDDRDLIERLLAAVHQAARGP